MEKKADITFKNSAFTLTGEVNFFNVMSLYQKSLSYLDETEDTLTFDFSKVKSSDSAGLALIVEWIKLAKQVNKSIQIKHLSQDLKSIAHASGLDKAITQITL